MLKTSNTESAKPRKSGVGVGDDNKVGRTRSEIDDGKKINVSKVDGDKIEDDEVGKKAQTTSKPKNLFKFKKMVGTDFLIPEAKLMFTKLR